jgi:hypothetical protein
MKMPKSYEIVCPDGKVRSYPHINKGDADSDARYHSHGAHVMYHDDPAAWRKSPCPQGKHTVRKER